MLNKRGITLLESAIALVIFGIIIAGIWIVYAKVSFNNNVRRTEEGILKTAVNIHEFYKDRPITAASGLDNTQAIDFDLIAPELLTTSGPVHFLGANGIGNVAVIGGVGNCPPNITAFHIRLSTMSTEGCNQLAAHIAGDIGKTRDYNIVSYKVNVKELLQGTNGEFDVNAALSECEDSVTSVICFGQN